MTSLQTLATLSALTLMTACASTAGPGTPTAMVANANAQARPASDTGVPTPMAAMGERMKDMRDKMMKAKTPEERQALMADHMKTMQDGMQMMKGMGGMGGMGDGKAMSADMTRRHQMMQAHMDMMQTMMDMMVQRMPAPAAAQ